MILLKECNLNHMFPMPFDFDDIIIETPDKEGDLSLSILIIKDSKIIYFSQYTSDNYSTKEE